jgi:hypothetical protein
MPLYMLCEQITPWMLKPIRFEGTVGITHLARAAFSVARTDSTRCGYTLAITINEVSSSFGSVEH